MNALEMQLPITASLCGLIWTIQLVHYPSFRFIAADQFPSFHELHSRRITWLVLPLMVAEAVVATAGLFFSPTLFQILGFLLVVCIWLSTFFISVPLHNRLSSGGADPEIIAQLVRTNWLRTVLWTLAMILLLLRKWL
jgi:hypothetical protein